MNKNLFFILMGICMCLIIGNVNAGAKRSALIYGHRGARGLVPENTIPAYAIALRIGVNYVDMDVGMTKDGVVVVTHDFALNPDLTRKPDGTWVENNQTLIKDLTYRELQKYDVGQLKPGTKYAANFPEQVVVTGTHIPSLQQVITYVRLHAGRKVNFQVEIKTDPAHPEWTYPPEKIARAVVKILKNNRIDKRTDLQAFDWRVLQIVQKLDCKIATAYLTDQDSERSMRDSDPKIAGRWTAEKLLKDYDDSIPKMIAASHGKIWGPESTELNAANVAEAHKYGLRVVPWAVNTEEEMGRMLELKVDGIITDRPDILHQVIDAQAKLAQEKQAIPR